MDSTEDDMFWEEECGGDGSSSSSDKLDDFSDGEDL